MAKEARNFRVQEKGELSTSHLAASADTSKINWYTKMKNKQKELV